MRNENADEQLDRERREALEEAGMACLDWAQDTGECHLCSYDSGAGKPHEDHCPLQRLPLRCRDVREGEEDDPSGVWECSLFAGHKEPHCDGHNGHTWVSVETGK